MATPMSEHDAQGPGRTTEESLELTTDPTPDRTPEQAHQGGATRREADDETPVEPHEEPGVQPEAGEDPDAEPVEDEDRQALATPEAGQASQDEERERQEQFAREHDPADHDIEAGEEFRQPGDWVADEDEPQQLETETPHQIGGGGGQGDDGEEIRDGGHGWGSAAPLEGGRAPEGHPVKAWHDTMTYLEPGEDGYDGGEAHEWFVDAQTAQRAGFRHAHGG